MPELPEVETSRRYVEEFCLGSTITRAIVTEQGGGPRSGQFDDLVIGEGVTAECLKKTLEGRDIIELRRRGKQMWFVLDKPPHPLFHFGMTGAFTVKGEKRHKFVKFKVDEQWPPRFAKLELQMSNGTCLALTDPRRLARVKLREEPEASPPISLLGPDPVTHPLSLETFAAALEKVTAPIKAVLLAQDRVVSGVGNWVADEVCFQARVHPGAACNTLAPEQVAALHTKLLSVCREACEARADYTVFPKEWLFHHRWGKGKSSEGAPRVSSGHPITFDVVGGRTTAIVAALQKKGLLSSPAAARASGSSGSATGKKKSTKEIGSGGDGTEKGKGKAKAGSRNSKKSVPQEVKDGEEQARKKVKHEESAPAKNATAQKKRRAGVEGGGAGSGKSKPTKKAGATSAAARKVKVEPVVAKLNQMKKPKATAARAAPKKTGLGKKTKSEPQEEHQPSTAAAAKASAKRGRRGGKGEDGDNNAGAKGKRAKITTAVVKPAAANGGSVANASLKKGGAATTAKRVAGRRSPRLSG
eukprot:g8901.t1